MRNAACLAAVSIALLSACQNKLRVGGRVAPVGTARPAAPIQNQNLPVKIDFDLADALASPKSVLILAIGHAEGTINLDGSPTQAYYGHGDSGFNNVGVFSCISCGTRGPVAADEYYLENKIKPMRVRFEDAARGAMLPANHPMLAAAFFTLLTQSPLAATDRKGFLDRMAGLKAQGISLETLIQLSVDSYRDPDTNEFKDVARFNNDETRIRADQKRRLVHVEDFLRNRGIELYPR
ncbi:hypothetical protein EBR21_08770 [bacterium]|nr:hypothetical protein [bacterium]